MASYLLQISWAKPRRVAGMPPCPRSRQSAQIAGNSRARAVMHAGGPWALENRQAIRSRRPLLRITRSSWLSSSRIADTSARSLALIIGSLVSLRIILQ